MKIFLVLFTALIALTLFITVDAYADCGVCGTGESHDHPSEKSAAEHPSGKSAAEHPSGKSAAEHPGGEKGFKGSCFGGICATSEEKGGIIEISYDQFQKIRSSGEKYALVDALSAENYAEGHIEGAISFPVDDINSETAAAKLSKSDNVIVYCGSFKCSASTAAAHRLEALGYKVVDYKGGLKEWQEKGNTLVK